MLLFEDKKTEIITQIKKDIKEYNGVKFLLGLSLEFYKDEKDGTRKFFSAQKHGNQCAVLSRSSPAKFYDEQVETIQRWIENFTNAEGTGAAINHCIRIYLNIAKYEPPKGSFYIKTPKIIANTKSVVNVQNDDDKCLEWALKSALYPVKTNTEKVSSYIGNPPLKIEEFPTPINQISKVEKQNNLAINVLGCNVSNKFVSYYPLYLSNQQREQKRINLLLLEEETDIEDKSGNIKTEYKTHYC